MFDNYFNTKTFLQLPEERIEEKLNKLGFGEIIKTSVRFIN